MNIFFIPSWYRTKENPLPGIFFKDQALAVGEIYSQSKVIISLAESEEYSLPLNRPLKAIINLLVFSRAHPSIKKIAPNVWEFRQPALVWNQRILSGNLAKIVQAHEANFLSAQKKLGRIDIIHAQSVFRAGLIARRLSQKYHLLYIIDEHVWPFPSGEFKKNKLLEREIFRALQGAAKVTAVSHAVQKDLKKCGFSSVYIPNAVDENDFKPILKKNHRPFIFFTLGRITVEKGIGDLIKAAAIIIKTNKIVQFRIGGEGADLKSFQQKARELKVDRFIKWLGPLNRSQVKKEFQNCDAFVLPSHHESFGVVYIEALACGKPIIATRCGGPESIVNQKNGLLVNVGDIDSLAGAMKKMIEDIQLYSPNEIRKDFLTKYSYKAVAKKLMDIYDTVTKNDSKK